MNTAGFVSCPSASATPKPVANGTTTPISATAVATRAHTSQVDQVHLHTDEEQQQQHAHLGEHLDRHAAIAREFDPAEHRRTDDDAADDLAEHGWRADPLGQFAEQHGRPEHDEEIEEQAGDVDGAFGLCEHGAEH